MELAAFLLGAASALAGALTALFASWRFRRRADDELTLTLHRQIAQNDLLIRTLTLVILGDDAERETLEITSNPDLMKAIEEGLEDVAAGRTEPLGEIVPQAAKR